MFVYELNDDFLRSIRAIIVPNTSRHKGNIVDVRVVRDLPERLPPPPKVGVQYGQSSMMTMSEVMDPNLAPINQLSSQCQRQVYDQSTQRSPSGCLRQLYL